MKFIFTCNDNTNKHLQEELTVHNVPGDLTWFNNTEALFETDLTQKELLDLINTKPLVFIRHLFLVIDTVSSDDLQQKLQDINLDASKTFSVQLRSPQHLRKHAIDVRNAFVDNQISSGLTLDVKNPEQILTLYFTDDLVYIGLGDAQSQRSKWSAGAMHFSRDQSLISRAEFKLREAFESFPINHQNGVAVDLGAAPGGWSQVLHDYGYSVIAIDPANLDDRVLKLENVSHYSQTSLQFLRENPDFECDVIVNDMKMSAGMSIDVLSEFAHHLSDQGFGIITIKLSKNFRYSDITHSLRRIRSHFNVIEARQLFHNRNEYTVFVNKSNR